MKKAFILCAAFALLLFATCNVEAAPPAHVMGNAVEPPEGTTYMTGPLGQYVGETFYHGLTTWCHVSADFDGNGREPYTFDPMPGPYYRYDAPPMKKLALVYHDTDGDGEADGWSCWEDADGDPSTHETLVNFGDLHTNDPR